MKLIVFLVAFGMHLRGTSAITCYRGEYIYTPIKGLHSVCRRCQGQTFMDIEHNEAKQCYPCSKISDDTKWFQFSPCTRERDAVICPLDGFAYELNDPNCRRISGVCGPGGHLTKSTTSSSNQCLMCPDGFYMDSKSHTYYDCFKCPVASDEPNGCQVVLIPCTRIRPAVIGCQDDYFDMPNKSSTHGVQCHKCKSCKDTVDLKFVGRTCTQFSNTVCCPRPNMEENIDECESSPLPTEPRGDKPSVSGNNTRCKENQFLDFNEKSLSGQSSCKPCPKDTYRQESNHTNPMCNNCSDYRGDNPPQICNSDTRPSDFDVVIWIGLAVGICGLVAVVAAVVWGRFRKRLQNSWSPPPGYDMTGPLMHLNHVYTEVSTENDDHPLPSDEEPQEVRSRRRTPNAQNDTCLDSLTVPKTVAASTDSDTDGYEMMTRRAPNVQSNPDDYITPVDYPYYEEIVD